MKLVLASLEYLIQPFDFRGLKVFCKSLRQHYTGDCVFFVRNLPLEATNILKKYDIKTVDKTEYEIKHNIVRFGINATRRVYYYLFLKQNPQYDDILSTDVTDVVVQSNPFNEITNGVTQISAEAKNISECVINAGWIEGNYGPGDYNLLKDKPILCAGIIRGNNENTKILSKLFVKEVTDLYTRSNGTKFGNLDQAHIEYIFHMKDFSKQVLPYLNNSFVHIGHTPESSISISDNKISIESNGLLKTPALVHQYNRHKGVEDFLYSVYD